MASVYRCSEDNRAKQEERRGEIRYGREGRGAERRRLAGTGRPGGERRKEGGGKKKVKKKKELRKEAAR